VRDDRHVCMRVPVADLFDRTHQTVAHGTHGLAAGWGDGEEMQAFLQ
jgi:hypothetical protein